MSALIFDSNGSRIPGDNVINFHLSMEGQKRVLHFKNFKYFCSFF